MTAWQSMCDQYVRPKVRDSLTRVRARLAEAEQLLERLCTAADSSAGLGRADRGAAALERVEASLDKLVARAEVAVFRSEKGR